MNKELLKDREFIGDGVYVGTDEYDQLILYTERAEGTHWMALGTTELMNLNRYVKTLSRRNDLPDDYEAPHG